MFAKQVAYYNYSSNEMQSDMENNNFVQIVYLMTALPLNFKVMTKSWSVVTRLSNHNF